MSQAHVTTNGSQSFVQSIRSKFASGDLGILPVLFALVLIWLVFQSINSHFLSGRNLSNLVLQIAEIGMLGVGETLILLLGEIDLSIASVSGVAAAVLVTLSVNGMNPVLAMVISILCGAAIGLVQGLWVTLVGVPSFIVTLAGSLGYQGILLAMLGQEGTVPITNPWLLSISSSYIPLWAGWVIVAVTVALFAVSSFRTAVTRTRLGLEASSKTGILMRIALVVVASAIVVGVLNNYRGVPVIGFILILFVIGFAFLTQSTKFGRHVYALGGNAEATRRAGINVRRIRIAVFTLCSTLGAIGGILGASRLGSASPASGGGNLLLDSIAAAVIGGTSLFGGRGSVYNALAGALVIGSVENGMDLLSAPSSTKYMIEGLILIIAVTVDTMTRKRRSKSGR